MNKNLILGVLFSYGSIKLIIITYLLTLLRPEMLVAADNHVMHLWEYEFIRSNHLIPMVLMIAISAIIGIVNLCKYYRSKEH